MVNKPEFKSGWVSERDWSLYDADDMSPEHAFLVVGKLPEQDLPEREVYVVDKKEWDAFMESQRKINTAAPYADELGEKRQ